MEELAWNRFDCCINDGLTLIVDEHESLSLDSFVVLPSSIGISSLFSEFN
jgi:hypothetical protein